MSSKKVKNIDILKGVENVLTKSGLVDVNLNLNSKTSICFDENGKVSVAKKKVLKSNAIASKISEEILKIFKQNLNTFITENPVYEKYLDKFTPKDFLEKGEKYEEIKELINLEKISPETASIKFNLSFENKPLLIIFWAAWCDYSIEFLKEFQELQKEKLKELSDIRIIFINLDEKLSLAKDAIQLNSLASNTIEHYWLENWSPENTMVGRFLINYIPQIVVVDKGANIRFKGGVYACDLEEQLEKCLKLKNPIMGSEFKAKALIEKFKEAFTPVINKGMTAEIVLKKQVKYKIGSEEGKMNKLRAKPIIKLDYGRKNIKEINNFVETLAEKSWSDIIICESKMNPQGSYEGNLIFLADELKKHNLHSFPLNISKVHEWFFDNKSSLTHNKNIEFEGLKVPLSLKENVDNFNKSFEKYLLTNPRETIETLLKFEIESCLHPGEAFEPFKGTPISVKNFPQEEKQMFRLNILWASWVDSFKDSTLVGDFLEKLGDTCQIALYCLDETTNEVLEQVSKFPDSANFYLLDQNCSNMLSDYGIDSLPHAILVSPEGNLIYSKYLDNDSEKHIVSIVKKNEEAKLGNEEGISKAQYKNLKSILKCTSFKNKLESFKPSTNMSLIIQVQTIKTYDLSQNTNLLEGASRIIYKKPKLIFEARQSEAGISDFLETELMKDLIPNMWIKKVNLIKTIQIKPGKLCFLCSKILTEKLYHMFDPYSNVYYCMDCSSENKPSKITDNLILIHNEQNDPNCLYIDQYKIGHNIAKGYSSKTHRAICDECKTDIIDVRWVCLSCKPGILKEGGFVDFCNGCQKGFLEGQNSENAKTHNVKNHLVLRVLYSTGKYGVY